MHGCCPINCVGLVVQIGTLDDGGQIDLPSGARPPAGASGPWDPWDPTGPQFVVFTSGVKLIAVRPPSARRRAHGAHGPHVPQLYVFGSAPRTLPYTN